MNVAIVGIGKWGKNLLKEFDRKVTVTFCVSHGSIGSATWLREHFPTITHATNLEVVLQDRSIDAIVVATPIETHFQIACRALLAGKHVFVEKPTATRQAEFVELNAIAKEKNKVLFTGYIFLYHDIYRFIKKNINPKDITSIFFEWKKMGTFSDDIYWNLLSHDVAMCIGIFGTPKGAQTITKKGFKTANDSIVVRLEYSDFPPITISINRYSKETFKKIIVEGKSGTFLWENSSLYKKEGGNFYLLATEKNTALQNEIDKFIHLVERGVPVHDEISGKVIDVVEGLKSESP